MALSNSQYEAIIQEYERTRDLNRRLLEERQQEVYRIIPSFRELEESVSSLSVAAARQMLEGNDNALERLKVQLSQIADQKTRLLTDAGFSADYLSAVYSCPDCQDTGYVTGPDGLREKCHCFKSKELFLRYEQSNIQDMIQRENFSTLSYEYYQEEDLKHFSTAVELSKNFVQNFKESYHNLFFYGTVGTGKSFLSGCIARELLQSGHTVIYFSASELFNRLARYTFDSKSRDELQVFCSDLYDCDLLIIDDLGTESPNSFVASQLFTCLNERGLRRKSIIISTNLNLEDLRDRYSDRILSRIIGSFSLCRLTGPDIRILKKRLAGAMGKSTVSDT